MSEELVLVLAGLVTPFLVQLVRRVSPNDSGLNTFVAQAVTLLVSLVLSALALAATGELEWNNDLLAAATAVFTLATFLYKNFQNQFDAVLPSKF